MAGKYGGRFIKAPEGAATRPTSQVAREALFNILAFKITGSVFFDLFAGSGAVGIEALSRGAGKVVFVDYSNDCGNLIRDNLKLLGVGAGGYLVLNVDMSRAGAAKSLREGLRRIGEVAADVIFADPPYDYAGVAGLPLLVAESCICAPDGLLAIEHGKKSGAPKGAGGFELLEGRQYGDSVISIFRPEADNANMDY